MALWAGNRTIFAENQQKSLKNRTFPTPGVTHLSEDWIFWSGKPIHATNFWWSGVWDGSKYQWYFRLSESPTYPNGLSVLKTGPKIVHPRSVEKWSKTRQNDEVKTSFLPDFQTFLTFLPDFQGQKRVISAKLAKTVKIG